MSSADLFLKNSSLPSHLRKELLDFLESLLKRQKKVDPELKKGGIPGLAKGRYIIADDFDAPLDDFKDYM